MIPLKEAKKSIKLICSMEDKNRMYEAQLRKEDDCFGKSFDGKDPLCLHCRIIAELPDGRQEEIWVFCKEFSLQLLKSKKF